jgi:hypothetical protein
MNREERGITNGAKVAAVQYVGAVLDELDAIAIAKSSSLGEPALRKPEKVDEKQETILPSGKQALDVFGIHFQFSVDTEEVLFPAAISERVEHARTFARRDTYIGW